MFLSFHEVTRTDHATQTNVYCVSQSDTFPNTHGICHFVKTCFLINLFSFYEVTFLFIRMILVYFVYLYTQTYSYVSFEISAF